MPCPDKPGLVGWGESDSSPLVGLVAYVCPPSHTCIHNIASVVVGATISTPADILALHEQILGSDMLDIQQAEHAYSGCDIALWDALGKHLGRPVFELLHEAFEPTGSPCIPYGKVPYASVLFEDTPEQTKAVYRSTKHTHTPLSMLYADDPSRIAALGCTRATRLRLQLCQIRLGADGCRPDAHLPDECRIAQTCACLHPVVVPRRTRLRTGRCASESGSRGPGARHQGALLIRKLNVPHKY
jgi:hypothetical protein